jgi:hypothetical protein
VHSVLSVHSHPGPPEQLCLLSNANFKVGFWQEEEEDTRKGIVLSSFQEHPPLTNQWCTAYTGEEEEGFIRYCWRKYFPEQAFEHYPSRIVLCALLFVRIARSL